MKSNEQKIKREETQDECKKKNDRSMFLDFFFKGGWVLLILIGGIMATLTGIVLFLYIGIGITATVICVAAVGLSFILTKKSVQFVSKFFKKIKEFTKSKNKKNIITNLFKRSNENKKQMAKNFEKIVEPQNSNNKLLKTKFNHNQEWNDNLINQTKLNINEINSTNLQVKSSTSGYKPSSLKN